MNNYSRFVSYMYMYVDEHKEQNIGFAKVEIKDSVVRLMINLSNVMLDKPLCEIYLIKRGTNERVYVGSGVVKNGQFVYKDVFKEGNIDGDCEFSDFIGIIILNSETDNLAFATVWVDDEVNIFEVNKMKRVTRIEEEDLSETVENRENCEECEGEDGQEEKELQEQSVSEAVEVNAEPVMYEEKEKDFMSPFNNFSFINAFCDDYYYDLVEICPEDILKLPPNLERLKNNSFIMHGFYNYRHLLLGRVRDNDNKCFIGVPGTYHNTEKYMAMMFGFDRFKCSHRSDVRIQGFGYWYIEAPI